MRTALTADMWTSDEHLEEALEEYNLKVSELETCGTHEELLEALVNRSTVLIMMESFTSAMTDLEDCIELSELMEERGERVDTGTFIKIRENRGQLFFGEDDEAMVSDYSMIASRLDDVHQGIRHYDRKGLVQMCIDCAEDLLDQGYDQNSVPFIEKGLELIGGNFDRWSSNRRIELSNLMGQASDGMGLTDRAYAAFTDSINIGAPLFKRYGLEDDMALVLAFICRGDINDIRCNREDHIADHESAADIMEQLYEERRLGDVELLVNLHRGLASAYSGIGDTSASERHLIRALRLSVPSMGLNERGQ